MSKILVVVSGVAPTPEGHKDVANAIFKVLKDHGYTLEGTRPCAEGVPAEPGKSDLMEALSILRDLDVVKVCDERVYYIREREGEGWYGPEAKKWANATERLKQLLEKYK